MNTVEEMNSADQGSLPGLSNFSDADFQKAIWSALRLVGVAVVVGVPVLWWKLGWQSAVLLLIGAGISGSGIYEWLRLMTALMARMDTSGETPARVRPMGPVLAGFFVRLAVALGLLYGSLKLLNGSVYALIAGLALGVVALSIEGLRLIKSWTV